MKNLSSDSLSSLITAFSKTDSFLNSQKTDEYSQIKDVIKNIFKRIKFEMESIEVDGATFSLLSVPFCKALLLCTAKGESTSFVLFVLGNTPNSVQIDSLLRISRTSDSKKTFSACVAVDYQEAPTVKNNIHILNFEILNNYLNTVLKTEVFCETHEQDFQKLLTEQSTYHEQIDDFCAKKSLEWATTLSFGFLSDARDIAKILKRTSYTMRITSDINEALNYIAARELGFFSVTSAPIREAKIAEIGFDTIKLPVEDENPPSYDPAKFTLLCWGNDMKWAGKWKFNKLSANIDGNPTAQVYSKMLSISGRGIIIYIPNTAEMVATKRALMDAGVLSI